MAIFTLANLAIGAIASLGTFSLGTCLLRTNLEEFDMGDYHDRH
ncbi:hypothetical protein [Agrobacterium tumefaciens]|nr:hypothetical protein [Agrobacterium tumefaciens]